VDGSTEDRPERRRRQRRRASDAPPSDAPPSDAPPSDVPKGDTEPATLGPDEVAGASAVADASGLRRRRRSRRTSDAPPADALPSDAPPSDALSSDAPHLDDPQADVRWSDSPPSDAGPPRPKPDEAIGAWDAPDAPSLTDAPDVPSAAGVARVTLVSPLQDFQLRDQDPAVCPFFRSVASDGSLAAPIGQPDDANRCAAFGEPLPQSARQQELVCRTDAHTGCPRYLRGSAVEADDIVPERRPRTMTTAILSSILLLVATMAAAISFVIARGGLDLPSPALPTEAAVLPTPTIVPLPSTTPVPVSPAPSAAPTPSPAPTPTPTATPLPSPTSDRYALLEPCPDQPDCWIYTVRAGDNLSSIANYFGIPLSVVYDLNPELRTQALRPGKEVILPPPTR